MYLHANCDGPLDACTSCCTRLTDQRRLGAHQTWPQREGTHIRTSTWLTTHQHKRPHTYASQWLSILSHGRAMARHGARVELRVGSSRMHDPNPSSRRHAGMLRSQTCSAHTTWAAVPHRASARGRRLHARRRAERGCPRYLHAHPTCMHGLRRRRCSRVPTSSSPVRGTRPEGCERI